MTALVFIVVLVSSIWVLVDASRLDVKKGLVKGLADMGPWGWFFACVFLWIIAFPMYLATRPKYVKAKGKDSSEYKNNLSLTQLEKLEKLGKMKEKGIITEEEFNEKKKELLRLIK